MSTISTQVITSQESRHHFVYGWPVTDEEQPIFLMFPLTSGWLLIYEANLIAQTHSMERN